MKDNDKDFQLLDQQTSTEAEGYNITTQVVVKFQERPIDNNMLRQSHIENSNVNLVDEISKVKIDDLNFNSNTSLDEKNIIKTEEEKVTEDLENKLHLTWDVFINHNFSMDDRYRPYHSGHSIEGKENTPNVATGANIDIAKMKTRRRQTTIKISGKLKLLL